MQKQDSFDDIFGKKLSRYESDIPENLWQKIEARRRKKRRGGWIFLWAFGLSAGVLAYAFFQNQKDNTVRPAEIVAPAKAITAQISQENLTNAENNFVKTVADHNDEIFKTTPAAHQNRPPAKAAVSEENLSAATPALLAAADLAEPSGDGFENEFSFLKNPIMLSPLPARGSFLTYENSELTLPDPQSCFSFSPSGFSSFYVDVMAGPGYALRSLKDKTGVDQNNFSELRDSTERAAFAFGAAVRASVRWRSGLTARAGLAYYQINEVFDYENAHEVRTIVNEIFDIEGNLLRRDTLTETGTRILTTNNHFRYWDIPLMLGYEWESAKSSFSVNAGVSVNISSAQKGKILSPATLPPVSFTSGEATAMQLFETNVGLSVIGSLAYTRAIAKNLHWTVEPNFRYFTKSVAYDQPLEQKYFTLNLYTGLRYYFK